MNKPNIDRETKCIQYLDIMINDVSAATLLINDPFFKIIRTIKTINKREYVSEKQILLIERAYKEYLLCKKVHSFLIKEDYDKKIIRTISNFLNALPKSKDRTETGKRAKLGTIRSRLSNGDLFHLKTLEKIENICIKIDPKLSGILIEAINEAKSRYIQIYDSLRRGIKLLEIHIVETPGKTRETTVLNYEKEKGTFSKIDDSKKPPNILFEEGLAYAKNHQYEEAIQKFTRAIALDENNGRLWYHRALTYLILKDPLMGMRDMDISAKLGNEEARKWLTGP